MRKSIFKLAAVGVVTTAMAVAAPAFAQETSTPDKAEVATEEVEGPITISGGVTVVSDYRFRGVSLSDKDFALQPTLTIKHESGLYAGVWASNIADNAGDDLEVDLYAGFAGGDAVTYDIGATYYVYPGISGLNYVEVTGKLGTTVGPATVGAQISYVPSQDNTGNNDNIYIGTSATIAIPNSPISIVGTAGFEDGAFGDKKLDWSLGLTAAVAGFTVGAAYVDTNRNTTFVAKDSSAGVVFSVSYFF